MQDIQKLLDDVENEIFRRAENEIASAQIGELIMEHLKDLEEVAYVRFASVYREFTDVNTFAEELKKLLKKKKTAAKDKKGNEEA